MILNERLGVQTEETDSDLQPHEKNTDIDIDMVETTGQAQAVGNQVSI